MSELLSTAARAIITHVAMSSLGSQAEAYFSSLHVLNPPASEPVPEPELGSAANPIDLEDARYSKVADWLEEVDSICMGRSLKPFGQESKDDAKASQLDETPVDPPTCYFIRFRDLAGHSSDDVVESVRSVCKKQGWKIRTFRHAIETLKPSGKPRKYPRVILTIAVKFVKGVKATPLSMDFEHKCRCCEDPLTPSSVTAVLDSEFSDFLREGVSGLWYSVQELNDRADG